MAKAMKLFVAVIIVVGMVGMALGAVDPCEDISCFETSECADGYLCVDVGFCPGGEGWCRCPCDDLCFTDNDCYTSPGTICCAPDACDGDMGNCCVPR